MEHKSNIIVALASAFIALTFAAVFLYAGYAPRAQVAFGDTGAGAIVDDPNSPLPAASLVFAGPQADTVVAATNTARIYLEITNDATSSGAPALWCNTNGRPVTIGKGLVIFASSTKILTNTRSAITCRYQAATSGVAVFEK